MRKSTKEEFIQKAILIHGNKYDYSLVIYVNKRTKVQIICPTHGIFWQTPDAHIQKRGCNKCAGNDKMTFEDFVEKANIKHNFKYTYPHNPNFNNRELTVITCPIHGDFDQIPYAHLNGNGCQKCAILDRTCTPEEYIEKANIVHNNRYTYPNLNYINSYSKVNITCKVHGDFSQRPDTHLQGTGCPKCFKTASKLEKEVLEFVKTLCEEVKNTDRTILGGRLELDIVIPSIKLAIEFNGTYWHYIKEGGNRNHVLKSKLCKEKGYTLLHLREDLWLSKKEHMKKVIQTLINKK